MEYSMHPQAGKRVSLVLQAPGIENVLVLPVNPEEVQRKAPARTATKEAAGGAYRDIFGLAAQTGSIRGHTGWRNRVATYNGLVLDGHETFKRLHTNIYEEYFRQTNKARQEGDVSLLLVNTVDNELWSISPDNFSTMRSKTSPLLYRYEMLFTVMGDLNLPSHMSRIQDTLSRYLVSPPEREEKAVATAFALAESGKMLTQQALTLTYIVKPGDTLWRIARTFRTTVEKLASLNNIMNPDRIYVGQQLTIPEV